MEKLDNNIKKMTSTFQKVLELYWRIKIEFVS